MIPTIANECGQFLQESNGQYLIKNLPTKYQGFAKVKVRLSKGTTNFTENFNRAFKNRKYHLHQSSIFAYTSAKILEGVSTINAEPFYIFPIDGYKVLFNPAVKNIGDDYGDYDQLHIDGQLVTDQLKLSYQAGTLREANESNCEVIIYGISYYYALRVSLIEDYQLFFNNN
jgi:hypothetical protein